MKQVLELNIIVFFSLINNLILVEPTAFAFADLVDAKRRAAMTLHEWVKAKGNHLKAFWDDKKAIFHDEPSNELDWTVSEYQSPFQESGDQLRASEQELLYWKQRVQQAKKKTFLEKWKVAKNSKFLKEAKEFLLKRQQR